MNLGAEKPARQKEAEVVLKVLSTVRSGEQIQDSNLIESPLCLTRNAVPVLLPVPLSTLDPDSEYISVVSCVACFSRAVFHVK